MFIYHLPTNMVCFHNRLLLYVTRYLQIEHSRMKNSSSPNDGVYFIVQSPTSVRSRMKNSQSSNDGVYFIVESSTSVRDDGFFFGHHIFNFVILTVVTIKLLIDSLIGRKKSSIPAEPDLKFDCFGASSSSFLPDPPQRPVVAPLGSGLSFVSGCRTDFCGQSRPLGVLLPMLCCILLMISP